MIEAVQLEEVVTLHNEPRLLVEWSPRWQEFVTSLAPALGRSEARLAGEAPFGLIPLRIMMPSYLLEAFLVFCALVIPTKLAELRPYVAPRLTSHDVIYYTGDELPRTQDLGGAQAGAHGRAGGDEAHHRTQTIRISRGGSLTAAVVDAPNLKLPMTHDAVANLLAIQPNPGPPPAEGLRSSRRAQSLSAIVAPAPNVIRDYTRNGIALNAVVPPTPNFSRDQPLTAPTLNPNVIPPAPNVSQHALVAPAMAPAVIAPAPRVARSGTLKAPSLANNVIVPAPNAPSDRVRSAPLLAANVVPPAPGGITREISSSSIKMSDVAVVPPPASAPERATTRKSAVTLPAPSVIAPPPSTQVSEDMRHPASGSARDPFSTVVPPPPSQPSSGSFMSSLIGKIFGATQVVAPPPTVNSDSARSEGATLPANVVPPPPSVSSNSNGGNPRGSRKGSGSELSSNIIAPPPSTGISGAQGAHSLHAAAAPALGPPSVVPPPPSISGPGGGTGQNGGGAGAPNGALLANNVVPPPPSIGGGSAANGNGLGRSGSGFGRPLDVGSAAAPPVTGGSGQNGAVMTSQPGPKLGIPASGGTGSLAMSPAGGSKPGLGGSGGGSSIGRGDGPGSGMDGAGTGAGKSGVGRGSDSTARGGISPTAGPGGAGNAQSGNPPIPGVDISGGSSVVTLPSFGSGPAADDPPNPHSSSSLKQRQSFDVEIVATASSGGPFEAYKQLLHGETRSLYLETSSSISAVMQYADESGTVSGALVAPQSIRTNLPDGLPHARLVVKCTLDASGNLRNFHTLEPGSAQMTAKILTALRSWKFRPAVRGDQPIEVTAILGFNIDTNDRF